MSPWKLWSRFWRWLRSTSWPALASAQTIAHMSLNDEDIEKIAKALEERKAPNVCPCCGREGTLEFAPDTAQMPFGPRANTTAVLSLMPCAVLVCTNCGNVRMHALNAIGLSALGKRDT